MQAMKQIADEKGIKTETVLDAIQQALAAAFRKDFGNKNQNIFVDFDAETGGMKVWDIKTIVPDADMEEITRLDEEEARLRDEALARGEEPPAEDPDRPRFNPKTEIMITEAKKLEGGVSIGDELKLPLEITTDFGRMAAMTAKQVITQKLREAERLMIYEEYKDKVLVAKLDVDTNQKSAADYDVMSIPTTILYRNGKEVGRQIGFAGKKAFEDLMKKGI